MHLDMDAFFASVEQRDNPEYRGKPVVVGALPGNRGVVSTCSYEARTFGIHSAMPISEAYRRCPDAIYLHPSMECYIATSQQLMACLQEISPVIEPVSIDEAYLDISGMERLFGSAKEIGQRTKALIQDKLQLTASAGIGPNRLIAKLASDAQKPDGLTVVPPKDVLDFLAPMPVSNLRGVGKQTLKIFNRLQIHTVEQLRRVSLEELKYQFGNKGGNHLYNQSRGIASDNVGGERERQSISKETTFNEDIADQDTLRNTLLWLSSEVARSARFEQLSGTVITLKIRLPGFETHTKQRLLNKPTSSNRLIFQTGLALYRSSGFAGQPLRLIGIGISGWENGENQQADLFSSSSQNERDKHLYETMDEITNRFGKEKLMLGTGKNSIKIKEEAYKK